MAKPHKNWIFYLLALLYGRVTELRNFLFDKKRLHSVSFQLPIICVGNLAVGGTGKTPHTEFLLQLLGDTTKTAVLSRGYKRKTKGFVLADANTNAQLIGDEPFQIFTKFPLTKVAVDEKRVRGVMKLLNRVPETEVIILDDAFQHRHIQAGLNILLTDFNNLYTDDFMLPYGTLRELPKNSKRADIVIVTKCPADFRPESKEAYREKLKMLPLQELFFSTFIYGELVSAFGSNNSVPKIDRETTVFLLTGIENPVPMQQYIEQFTKDIVPFLFPDHHDFTEKELNDIEAKWNLTTGNKLIITTEKDAARLKSNAFVSDRIKNNTFTLPLEVKIVNDEEKLFIQKINDYVRKN